MLSKILPGGAAEQAGKLGEGTAHFKHMIWHGIMKDISHVENISTINVNNHHIKRSNNCWRKTNMLLYFYTFTK